MAAELGGSPADWSISEVGDGNLNLVFIVKGTNGGIAVKQALPYVRLVGESWPLPLSRSHYEYLALVHQARLAPGLVPAVLHHNEALALIAMELLEPHIIMRKGLVAGACYPRFVDDITTFLARTLFLSSDLAVPAAEKKQGIAAFAGNHALCKITEDLIFTEPYFQAEQNRWTSPWLDATAAALPRRPRPACRDLPAQAQIHGPAGSADPRRPPHRIDHGDGTRDAGDRSGVRVLRPDGVRSRRRARQSHHGLSGLAPATSARPANGVSFEAWMLETIEAGLDGVLPQIRRALARQGPMATPIQRRSLPGRPARRGWRPNGRPIWSGCSRTPSVSPQRRSSAASLVLRTISISSGSKTCRLRAICEARSLRLARAMMLDAPSFRTIGAVTKAAQEVRDWQPDFGG